MRIEYDATLDDITDAHLKAMARSRMAKRTRWISTFWVAVLSLAVTGRVVRIYVHQVTQRSESIPQTIG